MPAGAENYSSMDYAHLKEESGRVMSGTDADKARQVVEAVEKKAGTPTHAEIQEIYEGGTLATCLETSRALVKRSMEDAGLKDGNIAGAIDLSSRNGGVRGYPSDPREGPLVFYQQIMKRNWLGREQPTGEVLVVINLRNGSAARPNENTVITAVAKQEMGALKLDKGLFHVTTEYDYNSDRSSKKGLQGRLVRGELTGDEYQAAYKKNSGFFGIGEESLEEYWAKRDEKLKNDPAAWRAENSKGELLDRLQGKYSALLQEVQRRNREVLDRAQAELVKKAEERRKRFSKLADIARGLAEQGQIGFTDDELIALGAQGSGEAAALRAHVQEPLIRQASEQREKETRAAQKAKGEADARAQVDRQRMIDRHNAMLADQNKRHDLEMAAAQEAKAKAEAELAGQKQLAAQKEQEARASHQRLQESYQRQAEKMAKLEERMELMAGELKRVREENAGVLAQLNEVREKNQGLEQELATRPPAAQANGSEPAPPVEAES